MKKLTIAIASVSAAIASGAYADTVSTEHEELTLDIGGELTAAYTKSKQEDSELALELVDFEFKFKPTYSTASGLDAFAVLDLNSQVSIDKAYVGITYDSVTVTAGQQNLPADDLGVGYDQDFGVPDVLGQKKGSDVLKAVYEMDMFTVAAGFDLEEGEGDESAYDLFASIKPMDGITVEAGVQLVKAEGLTDDDDHTLYLGGSLEYSLDPISVGGEVFYDGTEDDTKVAYGLGVKFKATEMVSLAGGFGQKLYNDDDDMENETNWYVNGAYSLNDKVTAYTEVAGSSLDDEEVGYVGGLKVKF